MSSRNLPGGIPSNNPSAAVTQKPPPELVEEEEKQGEGTLPKQQPIILKKQISLHGGAATRLSSLESLGEKSIDHAFRSHNFSQQ